MASSTTHPIQTTTNTSSSPLHPPLPPPHTFDILPALHELLSRIDSQNSLPNLFLLEDSSSSSDNNDIGSHYTDNPPLQPKDLPEEVLRSIKSRIRAALRAVEGLPDVERSVEEQEVEIRELEERIRAQRGVLRGLGEVAAGLVGKVE